MGIPAHILPIANRLYYQGRCGPLESACAGVVRELMIASNIVAIVISSMQADRLLQQDIDRAR